MDVLGRRAPSKIGFSSERRECSEAGSSRWSARDDGASSVRVVWHWDLAEIVAALEATAAGKSVFELLDTVRARFKKSPFAQLKSLHNAGTKGNV